MGRSLRRTQARMSTRLAGLFSLGLVAAVIAALVLPAEAAHVAEPTAAIEKLALHVGEYATNRDVDCTLAEPQVVDFSNARIEAEVHSESHPSEHWRLSVFVIRQDPDGRLLREWSGHWRHQNAPPHAPFFFEAMQADIWSLAEHPGSTWHITVRVHGDESGRVIEESCRFTRA